MTLRMSEEEYRDFLAKRKAASTAPADQEKPKRRKYGNVPTERDGKKFDSKHEADVYDELMLLVRAGELRGVVCQIPFRLPGDVVYKADFVTLNTDGTYSVMDAKSDATRKDKVYRLKKRLMENELGLTIIEK